MEPRRGPQVGSGKRVAATNRHALRGNRCVVERRRCDDRVMQKRRASVAVILSAGGAALNLAVLREIPRATVASAEVVRGERAACATVILEHRCQIGELAATLRSWAAARGWAATVAPLARPD